MSLYIYKHIYIYANFKRYITSQTASNLVVTTLRKYTQHLTTQGICFIYHIKNLLEPGRKKSFHYTGCLIEILTMVYYNPHITRQYNSLYAPNNQIFFVAHLVLFSTHLKHLVQSSNWESFPTNFFGVKNAKSSCSKYPHVQAPKNPLQNHLQKGLEQMRGKIFDLLS